MNFLVTGGAGFIGSRIVKQLVGDNHRVIVLDNLTGGSLENLAEVIQTIEFIKGDIRDRATVETAAAKADYVIHLAALVSVVESIADPLAFNEVNQTGTLTVLEASRKVGVKRVVLASSSAVYGANERMPLTEDEPVAPLSPYGMTKAMNEQYARLYTGLYGLETVALRYFNVFGPGQRADSPYAAVIPKFITALAEGGRAKIFGDGEQTRDFIYVEDVAAANIQACTRPGIPGEVFNIGRGERVSVNQIYREIAVQLGKTVAPEYLPPREGEILHSLADVRKAQTKLGFTAKMNMAEGLRRTVAGYTHSKEAVI